MTRVRLSAMVLGCVVGCSSASDGAQTGREIGSRQAAGGAGSGEMAAAHAAHAPPGAAAIPDGRHPVAAAPPAVRADTGADDDDDDDTACGAFRADSQFERTPVDVVWAIDNSLSMLPQFLNVADGLNEFTAAVEASGTDMRVVMVSTFVETLPAEVHGDRDRYLLRPVDVQSTNAFDVLLGDFPNFEAFLRPNAATHVIVVTDFVNTLPRTVFREQLERQLGHGFTFHAIAEPLTGQDYYSLADETGGVKQPIASDWKLVFEQLRSVVVETARLPCQLPLKVSPEADLNNIQVIYSGPEQQDMQLPTAGEATACGTAEAWHFDDAALPKEIVLCPGACEGVQERGGSLEVIVGCEPPPALL
ncbi:MAG: VWA domain-containing protein [Myxococcales bacterium]|nr:VWA domain-containing protein [Myxococcales bacterium]MDD9964642.1 VWA domain-containing protein [Myxococcales bacterium]